MNDNVKEAAIYCTTAIVILSIPVGAILYGYKLNTELKLSAMQAGYVQTEQINSIGLKWVKIDNTNNVLRVVNSK